MCYTRTLLIALCLVVMGGCTSQATRNAIKEFQIAEDHKQVAFNNAYRMASDQMALSLTQFTQANADKPEVVTQAIIATWKARYQLEEARAQYLLARSLTITTVGQYLYDQQGALNVIFGDTAQSLGLTMDSVQAGDKAAGQPITDIVKPILTTQPATTVPSWLKDLQKMEQKP